MARRRLKIIGWTATHRGLVLYRSKIVCIYIGISLEKKRARHTPHCLSAYNLEMLVQPFFLICCEKNVAGCACYNNNTKYSLSAHRQTHFLKTNPAQLKSANPIIIVVPRMQDHWIS